MRKISALGLIAVFMLAVAAGVAIRVRAQEGGHATASLLVPGYDAARDVPGAAELPDPKIDYKVLFSVSNGAKDRDAEVNPMLPTLARYLNTLGKYGVPANHRHLVVMFHQRSPDFDIVMTNEAYQGAVRQGQPEHRADPRAETGGRRVPGLRPGSWRPEDRRQAGESRHPDRSVGDDVDDEPADEGLRPRRLARLSFRRSPTEACLHHEVHEGSRRRFWSSCPSLLRDCRFGPPTLSGALCLPAFLPFCLSAIQVAPSL